jgi:ABC-type protease/lipase transport system fused ATPase/permease subunit
MSRRALARRMAELGELIELGDTLARPVGTYSGGMKRRLDMAAALVHNPQIVFPDEPTTGQPGPGPRAGQRCGRIARAAVGCAAASARKPLISAGVYTSRFHAPASSSLPL